MSNRVTIAPTKFENVRSGSITKGIRFYDGYDQGYSNTWEVLPDDDLEVLQMAIDLDDSTLKGMLEFVQENRDGICIGDEYYPWDKIKHLF